MRIFVLILLPLVLFGWALEMVGQSYSEEAPNDPARSSEISSDQSRSEQIKISVPLKVSVGDFGEYGYEAPYADLGLGLELRTRHLILEASGSYSPTHKTTVDDGHSIGGSAALALSTRNGWFIGGGISRTTDSNSKYEKTATRPFATLGWDARGHRLSISRSFAGKDPNQLEGWTIGARYAISRRVRVGGTLFVSRFEQPIGSGNVESARGVLLHLDYLIVRH